MFGTRSVTRDDMSAVLLTIKVGAYGIPAERVSDPKDRTHAVADRHCVNASFMNLAMQVAWILGPRRLSLGRLKMEHSMSKHCFVLLRQLGRPGWPEDQGGGRDRLHGPTR